MLRKLELRDFQKHRKLSIRLDPNITTLVGPNDQGKSAVARALRWVCLNQPTRGSAGFVHEDADTAAVKLRVGKHKVERRKGRTTNLYLLDGKKYAAFGSGVPDEVSRVLKLDGANFQGQHDSVFWFAESPAEVSRKLNAVVDLQLIDTTLENLSRDLRKTRTKRQVVEERLQEAKKEREALQNAKLIDKTLRKLEKSSRAGEADERRVEKLSRIIEKAERLQAFLSQSCSNLDEADKALRGIEEEARSADKLAHRETALRHIVATIEGKQAEQKDLSKRLKSMEAELKEEMGDSCALCGQSRPR